MFKCTTQIAPIKAIWQTNLGGKRGHLRFCSSCGGAGHFLRNCKWQGGRKRRTRAVETHSVTTPYQPPLHSSLKMLPLPHSKIPRIALSVFFFLFPFYHFVRKLPLSCVFPLVLASFLFPTLPLPLAHPSCFLTAYAEVPGSRVSSYPVRSRFYVSFSLRRDKILYAYTVELW